MVGRITLAPMTQSPIEALTNGRWKPMWTIRLLTVLAMVACFLAMLVFKSGPSHSFCVDLTLGFLVGLLAQSFATQAGETAAS